MAKHRKPAPYPGRPADPAAPRRVLTGGPQHLDELADNANRRVIADMAREAEQK